jgi:hypothetical protein
MKRSLVVLFFLSAIFSVNAAADETDSGNEFLRYCYVVEKPTAEMTTSEMADGRACLNYIEGLQEGILYERYFAEDESHPRVPMPYCTPDKGLQNGQLARILLKFIRDNPAKSHKSTGVLFVEAMGEAFPCPETTPKKKQNSK